MTEQEKRFDAYAKALENPKNIRQHILSGVRFMNIACLKNPISLTHAINRANLFHRIGDHINQLTPRQFTHIFPIDKWYKGEKRELKDYFSTMEVLHAHGMDKPIGEALWSILWDYSNMETREFLVHMTSTVDYINLAEGKPSFLEEFLLGGDVEPEGEKPQHLKLVGGGQRGGV